MGNLLGLWSQLAFPKCTRLVDCACTCESDCMDDVNCCSWGNKSEVASRYQEKLAREAHTRLLPTYSESSDS